MRAGTTAKTGADTDDADTSGTCRHCCTVRPDRNKDRTPDATPIIPILQP
ncbi:hypothetical protein GCM10011609_84490 [Lentzea pudingi]|uniref:Uncharacterized protein n=1 Tax=Lentzea pudingi TaxID=1789439 RepID=A0ABQ2IW91_9PSEU|nr:hypothetical protein GCM10011609_84490 [Lentzea pudingi]